MPQTPALLFLVGVLLLAGCASRPPPAPVAWQEHAASVAALDSWSLDGRLGIRQSNQSDTVRLSWQQAVSATQIDLSSTLLGLGAVRIRADANGVLVQKAGEPDRRLPSLDALSREYIPYDFPAAWLQWWIRGLPVPTLNTLQQGFAELGVLQDLEQEAPGGAVYTLAYDRYAAHDGLLLPGRIRMESQGLRLTFLIDSWQTHGS